MRIGCDYAWDKIMRMFKDDGIREVVKSYCNGLFRALSITLIAFFFAYFVHSYYSLSKLCCDVIQIIGIVCAVAVLYGKSGWKIQTWGGNSPAEKWDCRLEYIFQSIGYFVAIFGLLLSMM